MRSAVPSASNGLWNFLIIYIIVFFGIDYIFNSKKSFDSIKKGDLLEFASFDHLMKQESSLGYTLTQDNTIASTNPDLNKIMY